MNTQDDFHSLAHSNLINHPITTIAFGTMLGLVLFTVLLAIISFLFGGEINIG